MKRITCYLDFISPYAYLAFEHLPLALQGLSYQVDYKPVLLGAMLRHHGQLGPAEVAPKRAWTYRQVMWLAHHHRIPLEMPAAHPFNPIPLLRLSLACGSDAETRGERAGLVSRMVAETMFRHVWRGGADALDAQRLQALSQSLAPTRDPAGEEVKSQLRINTDDAIARGLFGVPSFAVDDKLFWGLDALPMLRAWLEGDAWFDGPQWASAPQLPDALVRPPKA